MKKEKKGRLSSRRKRSLRRVLIAAAVGAIVRGKIKERNAATQKEDAL